VANQHKKTVVAFQWSDRQVEANSAVEWITLESGIYVNVNILPRAYADVMRALAALPRGTV
jgi:hypothetical protein